MVPFSFASRSLLLCCCSLLSLAALLVSADSQPEVARALGLEGNLADSLTNAKQPFAGLTINIWLVWRTAEELAAGSVDNVQVVSTREDEQPIENDWLMSKATVLRRSPFGAHIVTFITERYHYAIEFQEDSNGILHVIDAGIIQAPAPGEGNMVPALARELCKPLDPADRLSCQFSINERRGKIEPAFKGFHRNGLSTVPAVDRERPKALGNLFLAHTLLKVPITIAFCMDHYWQALVLRGSHKIAANRLLVTLSGLSFEIGFTKAGQPVWSDVGFVHHRNVVDKIYNAGETSHEQRRQLLLAFGDVERSFIENTETKQTVNFVLGGGKNPDKAKLWDGFETHAVPFEIEAIHWQDNAVYIYLRPHAVEGKYTRVLISYSMDDGALFKLNRFSLVNPQQRISEFLFYAPITTKGLPLHQSQIYAKLFEGFKDRSGSTSNFIISTEGVISLVQRTNLRLCIKVDLLQRCASEIIYGPNSLKLKLKTRGDPQIELLSAKFKIEDGVVRDTDITFSSNSMQHCQGDVIIGLDQQYYH
eukprot:GHVS01062429.1.p1 GENE.GHVS01062429.1~~GHVS01062429.1.p1  ORF type:complete len:535 (+),score=7.39 GHVS01062429.1:165-1769(+)